MSQWDALIERADGVALQHLGDTVLYQRSGSSPVTVLGFYQDNSQQMTDVGAIGVETNYPSICFRMSDLPGTPDDPSEEVLVIRNGLTYQVHERNSDDGNMIVMYLHKVAP